MKKTNIKIIVSFIAVAVIAIIFILFSRTEKYSSQGFSIEGSETQYIQIDENYKTLKFNYLLKDGDEVDFVIYDPNNNIVDSGNISSDTPYERVFDSIKGKWKVTFDVEDNKEARLESTIRKK